MSSEIDLFIKNIQKSKLSAQCPNCSGEFPLSKALLFDGRKKFPDQAEVVKEELQKEINERVADLAELQKKAKTGSEKAAVSIGVGKIIEKILPSHKNFNMTSADCRFLSEPIDMIFFDGLSKNKINHITFMDVKTGKSPLNRHQRQVRDAVRDQNVQWRQI